MTKNTFHCSIITPERVLLECEARFVAFPAHDGEVGILPHRAPLVYKLGVGPLRVEMDGETLLFLVDGGFAQMADNRLAILTQHAQKASEVNVAEAEKAYLAARNMRINDDQSHETRTRAIQRAQTQLRLARSR